MLGQTMNLLWIPWCGLLVYALHCKGILSDQLLFLGVSHTIQGPDRKIQMIMEQSKRLEMPSMVPQLSQPMPRGINHLEQLARRSGLDPIYHTTSRTHRF